MLSTVLPSILLVHDSLAEQLASLPEGHECRLVTLLIEKIDTKLLHGIISGPNQKPTLYEMATILDPRYFGFAFSERYKSKFPSPDMLAAEARRLEIDVLCVRESGKGSAATTTPSMPTRVTDHKKLTFAQKAARFTPADTRERRSRYPGARGSDRQVV